MRAYPQARHAALEASETVPEAAGNRPGACGVNPLDTFDRILASLHRATLDDTHWPATAALIDEACGAVGNALVVGEWSGDDVRVSFARFLWRGEPRPDVTREYFDVHYPHDEGRRRLRELPAGQLFHARDLYTEKELRTSPAYNEGLRRGRGQNGLQVRLDWQDGHRVVWTVGDPIAPGGWQSAQLQLLESLLPHVRQFVRVRQALVGADALSAGLAGLLDNCRRARKTDGFSRPVRACVPLAVFVDVFKKEEDDGCGRCAKPRLRGFANGCGRGCLRPQACRRPQPPGWRGERRLVRVG